MSYDFTATHHIGMNPNGTYANPGNRQFAPAVNPESAPIETRRFSVLLNQARRGDKSAIAELQFRGNSTVREGN